MRECYFLLNFLHWWFLLLFYLFVCFSIILSWAMTLCLGYDLLLLFSPPVHILSWLSLNSNLGEFKQRVIETFSLIVNNTESLMCQMCWYLRPQWLLIYNWRCCHPLSQGYFMSHYLMKFLRLLLNNITSSEAWNLPFSFRKPPLGLISPWLPRLGLNLDLAPSQEVRGRGQWMSICGLNYS